MRPTVKGLSSIDLPDGVSLPEDPTDCWIVVTASIGLVGDDGADDFTFYVCTPRRLERVLTDEAYVWGRHLLIVAAFDWALVRAAIERVCDHVTGKTWDLIANQLARHGAWEFEDYREASE